MAASTPDKTSPRHAQDPIAIIGMACRLPGNNNSPSSLWNFLENGRCAVTSVPKSRFKLNGHFDGSRKPNTLKSPGAMFLENVDLSEFDARFFGISAQEAIAMDPQQRQVLEVVYECLENAGVTLPSLEGALMGCFVASSTSDYRDIHARDPEDRPANATVGLVPAILSNRVSHFFNLKGPSMTIDTACSASLVSLDVANKYLQAGEINSAIVAGVHLWLSPEANMDSGAMREAFSSSGKCHTFDAKADGYIKAEGTNAVLLKRLDDAIRDKDPIRAVIRGTATNSDGKTAGIANPSAESQAAAIEAAYTNAGIADMTGTTYLECHGTGTLAGDPVELQAASSILCRDRGSAPLMVGSIKSNVGHSECSAGISGLIKTVLALERGTIPGNPTFVTPNPNIDFSRLKVQASRAARPWPQGVLRRASVNSFGFGGSNAHVVVEEAKPWTDPAYVSSFKHPEALEDFFAEDDHPVSEDSTVLVFSANDEQALKSSVEALKRHVMNPVVKVTLHDLAYTLSERRTLHFYRGFITTDKTSFDSTALVSGKKSAKIPRVDFIFTGQGAQWPQMGKLLVRRFPTMERTLRYLDAVLQRSLMPPSWSLLGELCEPRSAAHLRQPAFSQPLVTAIQIVLVDLFRSFGIIPHAVIGHSSGEIAAAYCAGHLTMENAIKIAHYRGQAATRTSEEDEPAQGMLAAGLGKPEVLRYIEDSSASIACYNSPHSTTLSGTVEALTTIQTRLEADGHFARMLHVDLAYHSPYISSKANAYKCLVEEDCQAAPFSEGPIRMYSTVTGYELSQTTGAEYWQTNMTSPVLFDDAVRRMTADRNDMDFLVEIGPSGALAGPIAQILAMSSKQGSNIQYCAALQRGQEDLQSLFGVAGRLFIAGHNIDLRKVNHQDGDAPRVVVDLPNYAWNHATRYWHESEASKDWRFRLFPPHDLIGSKVLGTTWFAPVWKIDLDVNNVAWLKDHKLGSDIVVPGAAMLVMAVEAMSQRVEALRLLEDKPTPKHPCYRVRNIAFVRALVLQEGQRQIIKTELRARSGSKDGWCEFVIRSLVNECWYENSRGLVRVGEDRRDVATKDTLRPLVNSIPGALWYQAMEDVGYALGPSFQRHVEAESLSGSRNSRSLISLRAPPSKFSQTAYLMHPTIVDTILQACAPALWAGNRTNINAVIIPAMIDEAVVCRQPSSSTTGMLVASSSYSGLGDPSQTKNYTADAGVYDKDTGTLLFKLSRLRTNVLNTRASDYKEPIYCCLSWKPDITFLSSEAQAHSEQPSVATEKLNTDGRALSEVLELCSFKKPDQNVLESVLVPNNSTSVWLDHISGSSSTMASCGSFHLLHVDAKSLLETQGKYPLNSTTAFSLHDLSSTPFDGKPTEAKFDVIIARVPPSSNESLQKFARNSQVMLREGGQLILLEHQDQRSDHHHDASAVPHPNVHRPMTLDGFQHAGNISVPPLSLVQHASILTKEKVMDNNHAVLPALKTVHVLHFLPLSSPAHHIMDGLERFGWTVITHSYPLNGIDHEATILILDDLTSPLLSTIAEGQWKALQALFTSQHKILWLTKGSQLEVSIPENAQIHGLVRTIRDEDPSVKITTLDLEEVFGQHTISSVASVLERVRSATFQKTGDYEYADKGGILHISRVLQDDKMNRFTREARDGSELCSKAFHDTESKLQLVCERVGNLDSLIFHELDLVETCLQENEVLIEIEATGLNFKDIAISTGLIPGNERLLGFEGAGTITHSKSASYCIGQRVCFTRPGALSNRITVNADLVHPIPDSMSFEQAATVGAVFPVALYSLFDLAHIREGHRVLVHSAAGGLGIACIQICQAVGAEVFATVGNSEKRHFLTRSFGIDPSRIFGSRSTEFAAQLLNATNGEGVDVIVNSLTGDLLEESWNCIREGGTMIELGKRDINERNFLPMEPFSRNVSYQSFDISHRSVPNSVMARLLAQTFQMISEGRLKPIMPMRVFSLEDVTAAFRFMRDGKHMGKIVISSRSRSDVRIQARPALRSMRLRDDVSYLIVGGLKGLCGSIALTFARHGAKSLIAMGRSGFDDKASQTVVRNIEAEGCNIHLVKGDVIMKEDVQRAFRSSALPVGGVVQGAMAVRGKLYRAMSASDYHYGAECKVRGTWNLHDVALEDNLKLDFFSLLSSTSGVAGQSGQANYVAANAFLDAFAIYRRRLGFRANSIALGPMWDVGYMSRNKGDLPQTNTSTFTTISERLFLSIIEYSVLQQVDVINEASASHLITGMAVPIQESSTLRSDARFAALFGTAGGSVRAATKEGSRELETFKLLSTSQAGEHEILATLVDLVGRQLGKILQLNEPMEPAIAPSNYGVESLAAVELRNWVRMELQADVTILEILNASSLISLCEKIWGKIQR